LIKTNKRKTLSVAVIAVTIALIALLQWTAPAKTPEMKALPKARVALYHVQKKDITLMEDLSGRLIPRHRASLKFEVSGQVSLRKVEPGQRVEPGEVILQLENSDYISLAEDAKAQLQLEQAAIKRDRQLLELAKENRLLQEKEVKRLQRLMKKSLTSQSSLDSARQQLSNLKREVSNLQYSVNTEASRLVVRESALQRAQLNLERSYLKSPMKGVVNQIMVQAGDYMTPSQVVAEVVDDQVLEFVLNLRGAIAHRLQSGLEVDVTLADQSVTGHIVALQTDPDASTFTHEIKIRLPAGVGYSGQMVKARIKLPAMPQALVVPVTAIHYEEGKQYVMSYSDGKLSRQLIEPGPRVGNEQVILAGLQAGDAVVSRDVASLSAGQLVEVIEP